jgi:hypothetical protein
MWRLTPLTRRLLAKTGKSLASPMRSKPVRAQEQPVEPFYVG